LRSPRQVELVPDPPQVFASDADDDEGGAGGAARRRWGNGLLRITFMADDGSTDTQSYENFRFPY